MTETSPMQQAISTEGIQAIARFVNLWRVALGSIAAILVIGGIVTTSIGLGTVGTFGGTVLGQSREFDEGVATAVVGGAAIMLGVLVGTVWLAIGALVWRRRA